MAAMDKGPCQLRTPRAIRLLECLGFFDSLLYVLIESQAVSMETQLLTIYVQFHTQFRPSPVIYKAEAEVGLMITPCPLIFPKTYHSLWATTRPCIPPRFA